MPPYLREVLTHDRQRDTYPYPEASSKGEGYVADSKMSFPQHSLVERNAGQEEGAERRMRQEREAHKRNLDAAYRLMALFNENAEVFAQNSIAYCLDEDEPPFAPTICLFRRYKARTPEMTFITVIAVGEREVYSLRSLSKRRRREPAGWMTNHIKDYEEQHSDISNDPEEAAIEIMKRLARQEIRFNSLWEFDRSMGICVRRYFARRRAVLGLGFLASVAVAAILFWISRRVW